MTERKAYVYVNDIFAGTLEETDSGYTFYYDKEYIQSPFSESVSLTLPLSDDEYFSKTLFPFFDGLIPEGWLFDIVTDKWKINKRDRFAVLLAACKDPIGNVSVRGERV